MYVFMFVCMVTDVLGTRMNTAITTQDKNEDTFVVLSKLLKSVRLFTLDSGTRQQTTFMHSLLHDAIATNNELFACKLLSMMKTLRTEEDSRTRRRRQSGDVFAGRGGLRDTAADSDEEMVCYGKLCFASLLTRMISHMKFCNRLFTVSFEAFEFFTDLQHQILSVLRCCKV
jgi:hypothetical protein